MDPLVLEALRFGVAILAGGIVAVISSVLAFRYARRLQREEAKDRDVALRRALLAEIDENLRRIGDGTTAPDAISSSAWETARTIAWSADVLDVLADAYAAGAKLNSWVGMTEAHLAAPVVGDSVTRTAHREQQEILSKFAEKVGESARERFRAAKKALGEPVPENPASTLEGPS